MRSLLFALLLTAGCAPSEPLPAAGPPTPPAPAASASDDDRTITGRVAAVDLDPMMVDGDGIVTVETADGLVRVYIAARMGLCAAEILSPNELAVGDAVEVRGEAVADDAVRPCASAEHYFRRG